MRRGSPGPVGGRHGLLALLVGAIGLAGCGSGQTKTVSVSSASTPLATSTTSSAPRASKQASTPARTSTTTSETTQRAGSAPRTAPAPAFTQQSTAGQSADGEALGSAMAVVKSHGFTPEDTSDYHPDQTLRVLIGTRSGSGDGYGQQAFFFVDGRYIGTDSSEPSATLKVVGQSDTEVTLAYPLYRAHDPLCCPGGGQATVHFQLNNGRLAPLDPIPPVSSSSGLSRQ